MIFAKPLDRLVLEARKTQTRRPVKRTPDGTTLPCRWKVGHDYAVERPTGVPTDARIQITAVRDELLGDIDYHGIRAEGHKTRDEFADAWLCQHDRAWPPVENCHACDGDGTTDCDDCWDGQVRVHALDAHPCQSCGGTGEQFADISYDDIIARFDDKHAQTRVWVITFTLADVGRYLTPAARPAGSVLGYTTNLRNAMPDEPEVIDVDRLRVHWRDDATLRRAGAEDPHTRAGRLARRIRHTA